MNKELKNEVKQLIRFYRLHCSVKKFKDKANWDTISMHHHYLSFDFLKEFRNYLNWFWISHLQKLSEYVMDEFKNELDWLQLSYYQKMSFDFIMAFRHKVVVGNLLQNKNISEETKQEIKNNTILSPPPKKIIIEQIDSRYDILDIRL